jgi:2,4-dienoyl-CoA reductase-like NADH-dependent reductase (Old Yellow Enzyme family)
MTSMTRVRCDPKNGIPTDLLTKYYEQRSGCAFILTEASSWSPRGHAFPGAGNFFNKEQAEGWRKVVDAVHKKGTKIFLQAYHGGRASHSKINGGLEIWSSSPIAIRDKNPILNEPYQIPKQMT